MALKADEKRYLLERINKLLSVKQREVQAACTTPGVNAKATVTELADMINSGVVKLRTITPNDVSPVLRFIDWGDHYKQPVTDHNAVMKKMTEVHKFADQLRDKIMFGDSTEVTALLQQLIDFTPE